MLSIFLFYFTPKLSLEIWNVSGTTYENGTVIIKSTANNVYDTIRENGGNNTIANFEKISQNLTSLPPNDGGGIDRNFASAAAEYFKYVVTKI